MRVKTASFFCEATKLTEVIIFVLFISEYCVQRNDDLLGKVPWGSYAVEPDGIMWIMASGLQ